MAGRKADRALWRAAREVYVADTTAKAREEALNGVMKRDYEDYFLRSLPMMKMLSIMKTDPDMPDSDVDIEYLVDNIFIVGSPEEVAGKIRRLYEEVGGFGVLLTMGHEWDPGGNWLKSMTLLKQAVMPMLDDLD